MFVHYLWHTSFTISFYLPHTPLFSFLSIWHSPLFFFLFLSLSVFVTCFSSLFSIYASLLSVFISYICHTLLFLSSPFSPFVTLILFNFYLYVTHTLILLSLSHIHIFSVHSICHTTLSPFSLSVTKPSCLLSICLSLLSSPFSL